MKFTSLPQLRGRRPAALRLTRRHLKFFLAGLALLVVSFVLALYLLFPARALQERIERDFAQNTGADLTLAGLSLAFPPGLDADRVVLTGIPGRERLEVSSLTLRPQWATLFGRDRGVRFSGQFQGGRLQGSARESGSLEIHGARISIAEPLMAGSDMQIRGTLREGSYAGAAPLRPDTDTRFDLVFDAVELAGMEGMGIAGGVIPLGTVTLQGTGKGNSLRVETLSAQGGVLSATGAGTLMVASPADRSRLNLNITLTPGANLDPNLRSLLDIFLQPAGDGTYRLRLTGTLASPVMAR